MNVDTPPTPRSRGLRVWLIIESILAVPAIAVGGMMAIMSPMMFDAPGSDSNPPVILLFVSTLSFPLVCLASVIAAWVAFGLRRNRGAFWLSLAPLLPVLSGVAAIVWLQLASGGSFGR
jgi:hypothetical protein